MPALHERILFRALTQSTGLGNMMCYHPTTAVFLDDEQKILNTLDLEFTDRFSYKLYTDPDETLKYIHSFDYSGLTEDIVDHTNGGNSATFRFDKIYNKIYSDNRFKMPSILCTDQIMPKMDGITVCSKLANSPIFKILFTGQASFLECVKANQEGILDAFIHKSVNNRLERIDMKREEYQHAFFSRLYKDLIQEFVQAKGVNPEHYLFSGEFANLIRNAYDSVGACERYLCDTSGTHLFLTEEGQPTMLIVRTEDDVKDTIKMLKANLSEKDFNSQAVKDIESGKKLFYPGLTNGATFDFAKNKLTDYLFDAEVFDFDKQKLYLSYLTGDIPGIDNSKIVSYQSFLESQ